MRIQITDVIARKNDHTVIRFVSTAGTAYARWRSNHHLPVCGYIYDIELDIDEMVDLKKNARTERSERPRISHTRDCVVLHAVVEDMEADGMVTLRIATDCLVMMESAQHLRTGEALEIEVPASSVAVMPSGTAPPPGRA